MGLKCTLSMLSLNFTNNACIGRVGVQLVEEYSYGTKMHLIHASLGGAIYVEDASPMSYCTHFAALVPKRECFFQLPGQNLSNGIDVQLIFNNKSAGIAGSMLAIWWCNR